MESPPSATTATSAAPGPRLRQGRIYPAEWGLLVLLGLALACVWAVPWLPMQDYPQHLFQAKLVGQWLTGEAIDPAYQVHLHPTYSVFYLLVFAFSWGGRLLAPDAAGRCAVTVYVVMAAWAAWRLLWWRGRGARAAYAAFLLIPLAFGPSYYLGFLNYLYALPLFLVALLEVLRAAREGWTVRGAAVHAVLLLAMLMANSIALVMYLLAVGSWWTVRFYMRAGVRRVAVPLVLGCTLLAGWMAALRLYGGEGQGHLLRLGWQPLPINAAYWVEGFTGERLLDGPHWGVLLLWLAMGAVVVWEGRRWGWRDRRGALLAGVGAAVLFLACLLVPFSSGTVTYLGLRMAEGSYFLLVVLSAMAGMRGRGGAAVFGGAAVLLVLSLVQQYRVGKEVGEVMPLIEKMDGGAWVCPVVQLTDRGSPELDRVYFSVHLHEVFYYHLAKGGVSPYLFASRAASGTPVSYTPGTTRPAPPENFPLFKWEEHGDFYRYVLVRGQGAEMARYMKQGGILLGTSGKWALYERKGWPRSRP